LTALVRRAEMNRILNVAAAAIMASVSLLTVGAASAGAPTAGGDVRFNVPVDGVEDATAVLDAISVEMFAGDGSQVFDPPECVSDGRYGNSGNVFGENFDCTVPADTYTIGLSGLPAGFYVYDVGCDDLNVSQDEERFENPEATFTLEEDGRWFCDIRIAAYPDLYIDKVVSDPDELLENDETLADVSDFTLELFDDSGALLNSVVDTSTDACGFIVRDKCAVVPSLAPGDYQLGEVPVYGYTSEFSCFPISVPAEIFPGQEAFTHGSRGNPTLCTISNYLAESEVTVKHVVVNDDGGTATSADFTAELFHDGSLIVDETCLVDGSCFSADVRVGDYTAGVSGPAGYTHTVEVSASPVENEAIDDSNASFTLHAEEQVEVVITSDDPAPTTTTIAALPATGSGSHMSLVALAVLGAGVVSLMLSRLRRG
jgi:hypothetical protein